MGKKTFVLFTRGDDRIASLRLNPGLIMVNGSVGGIHGIHGISFISFIH